jgi:hypothetical protein
VAERASGAQRATAAGYSLARAWSVTALDDVRREDYNHKRHTSQTTSSDVEPAYTSWALAGWGRDVAQPMKSIRTNWEVAPCVL